jgi:diguanylate cyclase (GGDEF)-like protein/PAS domain S-box-containing protein
MDRVIYCLTTEHDWRLVLLAGLVCLLASLAAVSMFQQGRTTQGVPRHIWLKTAGVAAGAGVWATHFIAILAYTPGYPVSYDLFQTALSLIVGMLIITAGLTIAARVPQRAAAVVGGAIVGAGSVAMHYLGMAGLIIPATVFWNVKLVAISVIAAIVFSAVGLGLANRNYRLVNIGAAALCLSLAILSLHFIGMGAMGLIPDALTAVSEFMLSAEALSIGIASVVVAVLGMCLVGTFFDRRARRTLREHHKRLNAAVSNMSQGLCMFDARNRLVVWNERYTRMYSIDPARIWVGCTIRDLIDARLAAGTFSHSYDPVKYDADLRAALAQGKAFGLEIELPDGRTICVANQPIEGGGWVATHEDVTERKRGERELVRTRAFLDSIISNVPTPVIVKSLPDLRYLLVNKAAAKFFGMSPEAVIGKSADQLLDAETAKSVYARDMEMVNSGTETVNHEHTVLTPCGEARVITSTRLPVMGDGGKPQFLITVMHDLTDRKRDEARIAFMAHHDALTELPNRAAFNQCLNAVADLAAASDSRFGLLVADVDRYKAINDTFGSQAGDALLKQLTGRLQEACEGAFLARIGGDEFAVISPTGPQPQTTEQLARRLSSVANVEFDVDGHPVSATVTIGAAIFGTDGSDTTALLGNAEAALFRAKSEARGSIRFFEPEMDQQLREKRSLQLELRNALANDELELYYQPQAAMDGSVFGFEALARWHHPRRGTIPPSVFIPIAEESGLILALGEWVLRTACKEAASWPNKLRIAVNMSPVQFQHGEPVNLVHETLLNTGLSPGRLELEITEGVLIGDFSRAMAVLRRLKNMGVRIDMDDFGTGYSSLSYLQSFPFDKIKIDQCFVQNVTRSPQSAAIVRAVIGLGKGLGLPVIAEGVETKEQLAFLVDADCDGVQGYLIGRPQPIAFYAEVVGKPGLGPQLKQVVKAG